METTKPFETFRHVVLGDPELQARLRSIPDWPGFVAAAIGVAAECGVALTESDVLGARDDARRSWLAQWL